MEYQDYIQTELLILIPVLYCIGIGLKKSKMANKWIPITLGVIGVLLCAVWIIATHEITSLKEMAYAFFMAVTQGVLTAGASVYVNQICTQANKEE